MLNARAFGLVVVVVVCVFVVCQTYSCLYYTRFHLDVVDSLSRTLVTSDGAEFIVRFVHRPEKSSQNQSQSHSAAEIGWPIFPYTLLHLHVHTSTHTYTNTHIYLFIYVSLLHARSACENLLFNEFENLLEMLNEMNCHLFLYLSAYLYRNLYIFMYIYLYSYRSGLVYEWIDLFDLAVRLYWMSNSLTFSHWFILNTLSIFGQTKTCSFDSSNAIPSPFIGSVFLWNLEVKYYRLSIVRLCVKSDNSWLEDHSVSFLKPNLNLFILSILNVGIVWRGLERVHFTFHISTFTRRLSLVQTTRIIASF